MNIKQTATALITGLLLSVSALAAPLPYFGQTASSYQSSVPYGNNAQAGHYAQSGDTKIYYEVYGQGEPLVILHGGLVGSIGEMGELIDKLAPRYQIIAIATRGHGKSAPGNVVPSYEQKADDVAAVLRQVTRKPAIVLGFSDGAYTGYYFAAQYPQRISKLVAIGAGEWKKAWRPFGMPYQDFIALDPAYWQAQMSVRPDAEHTEAWYKKQYGYYDQAEVGAAQFAKVKVPTLVMAGEDDANAPLDTVIQAYKALPNADLAIIPDAPHPVLEGHFDEAFPSIEAFLAKPVKK